MIRRKHPRHSHSPEPNWPFGSPSSVPYTCMPFLWDRRSIGEINNTALILMGISAGTFAVGAVMDTTEIQQGVIRHQEAQPSINFFRDLLTDNNGISVHRFQNLVWTIVAIMVYFYRYSNPPKNNFNDLPTLDSTLLALTGISNATYLTLKTRENVSLKKPVTLHIKLLLDDSIPEKSGHSCLCGRVAQSCHQYHHQYRRGDTCNARTG